MERPQEMTSMDDIDRWLALDENVSLNNCDREAIHIPGTIQPHGVLLVLGLDGRVLQASQNAPADLGLSAPDVAERVASCCPEIFGRAEDRRYRREIQEIQLGGVRYSLSAHRAGGYVLCDLEPVDNSVSPAALLEHINHLSLDLGRAQSVEEVYRFAVESTGRITGFDRVMAYVFDADGHGTVIAEEVGDTRRGLIGLRFPGTDIPQQARRLYALELTRQIVDVEDRPIPILPTLNPITGRPLNMAFSQLRSISPIHVEYLKNMGVSASFSISVVVQGELVALIACHHFARRRLDAQTRQTCELLSRMVSGNIAARQSEDTRLRRNQQLRAQVTLLCELGERTTQITADSPAWKHAFDFVDAETLLLRAGNAPRFRGEKPAMLETLYGICDRLARESPGELRSTRAVRELAPETEGGGLLLAPFGEGNWVAWYRSAQDQKIRWAGKPENGESKELTPRRSFELWQEDVKGTCVRWSTSELEMAELLRRGLAARFDDGVPSEGDFEKAMSQLREYVMYLEEHSQALARANLELGQFAHIASHDLRAPLRTIRSFLPLLSEEAGERLNPDEHLWIGYIEEAANTLHRLQEGLGSYAAIEHDQRTGPVDLRALVSGLTRGLAADLDSAQVTIGELPVLDGVPHQLESLFRNLLDNASKYRSPDRSLKIVVDYRTEEGQAVFSVSDNGVGFPPSAEERVFDLFSRLHPESAHGDGLGLALCRRIVHHHRGWIRATSEPGNGSTFEFMLQTPAPEAR
ncbi:MAG: ATP-binding protein [Sandaracinaceae bacterium]